MSSYAISYKELEDPWILASEGAPGTNPLRRWRDGCVYHDVFTYAYISIPVLCNFLLSYYSITNFFLLAFYGSLLILINIYLLSNFKLLQNIHNKMDIYNAS
jgi:hypothetical protein